MTRGRGAALWAGALLLAGCVARPPSRGPAPERLAAALGGMIWPLAIAQDAALSSAYGARGGRHHDGLDIRAPHGETIHAARDGRVAFSGWRGGYGNTVVLDHGDGVTTLYGHASALYVAAGTLVARAQPIAAVGATGNASGNHLHFEVVWAGVQIDPRPLLPALRSR